MASIPLPRPHANDNREPPTPPQPGLRAYIVYDQLPEGCIAFEVMDNKSAPHFNRGDFAIIDTADRDPMQGELFLIEFNGGHRMIVETCLHLFSVYDRAAQVSAPAHRWNAEFKHSMMSVGSGKVETLRWFDGPYTETGIREKLVGKIVGIYEPDFRHALAA